MNTLRQSAKVDETLPSSADRPPVVDSIEFDDLSHLYRDKNLPNAMSVDVEDYFQVSAFDNHISRSDWGNIPARLPRNIDRILEIFDSNNVTATFFTLGWVCERFPEIVRKIVAQGHELASHGHDHRRVWDLGYDRFMQDAESTRKRLEDTSGSPIKGYRAPSFSIGTQSMWAYDALCEAGYAYSSSVFPIRHDHYGLPAAPRFPFRVLPAGMLEIPMSSVNVFRRNWPASGGGYFRLMPLSYSRWATRRISGAEKMPVMFYFHPWEIDPDQPRIPGIPLKARFRHYVNLSRFESRLIKLLGEFSWASVDEVYLGRQ